MTEVYAQFLAWLEATMREAHRLELYRTAAVLHDAVDTARREQEEIPTAPHLTATLTFGPPRPKRG